MAKKKISIDISNFIETIESQVVGAESFISDNNWVNIKNLDARKDMHDLQATLVLRNVNHARELADALTTADPQTIKATRPFVKKLLKVYNIHVERCNKYLSNINYEDLLSKTKTAEVKEEMKFQSDIANKMLGMKNTVVLIDIGDNSKVVVNTYGDTPIPFLMREQVEEKNQKVKMFMENKMNPENEDEDES